MRHRSPSAARAPRLVCVLALLLCSLAGARALTLTVVSPSVADLASSDVAFSLVTDRPADLCYVTVDGASHTIAQQAATSYSGTLTIEDGVHQIDYSCRLGGEVARSSAVLHIDTHPPSIVRAGPSDERSGAYAALAVDTDEVARCRYGPRDAQFDGLAHSMGEEYALHSAAPLALVSPVPQTYFVRCQDVYGNTMSTSQVVSFADPLSPSERSIADAHAPQAPSTGGDALTGNVIRQGAAKLSSVDPVLVAIAMVIVAGLLGHCAMYSPRVRSVIMRSRRGGKKATAPAGPPGDIARVLERAERDIDANEYAAALRAYRVALDLLTREGHLHAQLGDQVRRVYGKLLLFRSLDEARRALGKRDAQAARAALHEAHAAARALGDAQTPLMRDAREGLARFTHEAAAIENAQG